MTETIFYLIAGSIMLIAIWHHMTSLNKKAAAYDKVHKDAIEAGLTEPPSLHPVVDLSICMGSGACVTSCPEAAMGVIKGKALLISPSHCIGHGACETACPVGAIKLVFGTEKRGMDIPNVTPEFETDVPGLFIAGELGGMGLIRNAVKQGSQSIRTIAARPRTKADLDVLIVGAGPSGIAASLAAKQSNLRFITIDQEDSFGGTTYHYPRNKLVMTEPMDLPLIGLIKARELSKEQLMEIWNDVVKRAGLLIQFSEKMEEITQQDNGFIVRTNKTSYFTSNVLLAIGRRGTPRKLGAKGEDLAKVVYRLVEAEQYRNMHVLVVGGGDSALEAALDVSEEAGTVVTLSYRSEAFSRVKPKNRHRLDAAVAEKRIRVELQSTVEEITPDQVILKKGDAVLELKNDAVIVCAGGELPIPMLKKIGIKVESRYGT